MKRNGPRLESGREFGEEEDKKAEEERVEEEEDTSWFLSGQTLAP